MTSLFVPASAVVVGTGLPKAVKLAVLLISLVLLCGVFYLFGPLVVHDAMSGDIRMASVLLGLAAILLLDVETLVSGVHPPD